MNKEKKILYIAIVIVILIFIIFYIVKFFGIFNGDNGNFVPVNTENTENTAVNQKGERFSEDAILVKVISGEVISFQDGVVEIRSNVYDEDVSVRVNIADKKIEKVIGTYKNDRLISEGGETITFSGVKVGDKMSVVLKDLVDLKNVTDILLEADTISISPPSSGKLF